jgi:hypothetical protein
VPRSRRTSSPLRPNLGFRDTQLIRTAPIERIGILNHVPFSADFTTNTPNLALMTQSGKSGLVSRCKDGLNCRRSSCCPLTNQRRLPANVPCWPSTAHLPSVDSLRRARLVLGLPSRWSPQPLGTSHANGQMCLVYQPSKRSRDCTPNPAALPTPVLIFRLPPRRCHYEGVSASFAAQPVRTAPLTTTNPCCPELEYHLQ